MEDEKRDIWCGECEHIFAFEGRKPCKKKPCPKCGAHPAKTYFTDSFAYAYELERRAEKQ